MLVIKYASVCSMLIMLVSISAVYQHSEVRRLAEEQEAKHQAYMRLRGTQQVVIMRMANH